MSVFDTDIALPVTVAQIVDCYQATIRVVESAYASLDKAEDDLRAAFGGGSWHVVPHGSETVERVLNKLKRDAWQQIVNRMNVRQLMSDKRIKEMDANLDRGELPDITHESVMDMLNGAMEQSKTFAQEAIQEIFDFLRPAAQEHSKKFATNEKHARYDLGKRVIIVWALENSFGGGFRVNYYKVDNLRNVDKMFHLVDGKSFNANAYMSPLLDAIQTNKSGVGETDYFRFRCYQNGNLHLEYKRPDLVAKLNAAAAGHISLKG